MMVKLWSKAAVPTFAFCGCLIIADATFRAANPHYSFWVGLLDVGVCVTAVIGIIALICRFFNARALVRRHIVLGEDDLRKIGQISAEPGRTWARKRTQLSPYFEKLIQFPGTLVDVGPWTGTSSRVTVRTRVPGLTAYMNFSDRSTYNYPLFTLDPGQQLTVVGKIEDINHSGMSLVSCEIVSVGR
jgi:hypothetical protein